MRSMYDLAMRGLGAALCWALVACGATTDAPGETFDVGCAQTNWVVYDVQPGECLVAWSTGAPDMAHTVATDCKGARVCGLEAAQHVHVDQTPYDGQCNDFAQTGELVRPETSTLSVALRVDAPELARVEILSGSACDALNFGRDSY